MALQNPSNLYSGGQGVFDSRPSLMFQANLALKEKAKKDALDTYYNKAIQDITPAGMRNKDVIGGWAQKANDWKNFAIQNKQYLLKPELDNYQTISEFNRRHQELLAEAEKSKNELKDELMLNKKRIEGKWNPSDEDMIIIDKKGKSIYDQSRYDENGNDVDMVNLSFNIPEFDAKKQEVFRKGILGGEKPGKSYDEKAAMLDRNTGQVFLPFVESYSPETIKKAANNAEKAVSSDKSARKYYYNLIHNDPEFLEKANAALQSVEGKNAIVDSPAKAAKADWIMRLVGETKRGEDVRPDWQFKMEKQYGYNVAMEDRRHQHALQRLREGIGLREATKDFNEQETAALLDEYVTDQVNKAQKIPTGELNKLANQFGYNIPQEFSKVLPISTIEKEAFGRKNKYTGKIEYPEGFLSDKEGTKFRVIWKDGSDEISRMGYRATLGSNAINNKQKVINALNKGGTKSKSGSSSSKSINISKPVNKVKIDW